MNDVTITREQIERERGEDPIIYDGPDGRVTYNPSRLGVVVLGDGCTARGAVDGVSIWDGDHLRVDADEKTIRIGHGEFEWSFFEKDPPLKGGVIAVEP